VHLGHTPWALTKRKKKEEEEEAMAEKTGKKFSPYAFGKRSIMWP
jgi:hypothetical protein